MSYFGLHEMFGAKKYSGKFGKIPTKFLRTPKNLPAPTPMFNISECNLLCSLCLWSGTQCRI